MKGHTGAKAALIVAGLLVSVLLTHAAPADVEKLVAEIDDQVQKIDKALSRLVATDKDYGSPQGFGELLTWRRESTVVKMVDTTDSDGASAEDMYYFGKDGLIFVVKRFSPFPMRPEQSLSELESRTDRLYYHRGRMIRMLTTMERETDPRDHEFEEWEEMVGQTAMELLRFGASDHDDLVLFLEARPTVTDWYDLGPTGSVASLPGPVRAFLNKLSLIVGTHRWDELLTRAHPAHYRSQVSDLGMTEDQYVRELLGLFGPQGEIDRADRIRKIEFRSWNVMGRRLVVEGVATTTDGRALPARIELLRRFDGIYLTGAVG